MGVAGLWDVLKPAAQTRSLTELAITEGFLDNPDGKRGFRLGIDASIWFFHAEYGKEGENPVLRTLFFRCATLMHTTFLPIFVFDGPKRPDVKRGKKINRTSHKLIPGMKQIVEAFGFEWRMAPGEAEAELAYLNRIGIIDGVLSDDVDNFLFGATTVIRNSSSTLSGNRAHPTLNSAGKDDKVHTRVFRMEDITNHPDIQLMRGGLILIGLMSGGDYQQGGLSGCGVSTAHGLAKCGFGDSLYEAALALNREDLADFLVSWRQEIRNELRTDSRKIIGRKLVALSKAIPEDFPDIDILLSYVNPITSESMGRESNNTKLTWSKEPNLASLAETCEFYFEWGYGEAIVKRFRTVMWHSIVIRILRRAVLDLEQTSAGRPQLLLTPTKKKGISECGTPSKMIAKHFSNMGLNTPRKANNSGYDSENEDDIQDRLILKVHSMRNHTSTDGMLEYRLEIAPKQLVRLTRSGIKGIREPEGEDEWASEVEEEDEAEGGSKKRGKGQPVDPDSHLRVWMPACMVKLVEPALVQEFEDKEEQKKMKKAKKATRAVATKNKEKARKEKRPGKTTKKAGPRPPSPFSDVEDDLFVSSVVEKSNTATASHTIMRVVSISSSSEDDNASDSSLPSRLMLKSKTNLVAELPQPVMNMSKAVNANSVPEKDGFFFSPVSSRTGIRDLTKKKKPVIDELRDLKSFYPVVQHGLTTPNKSQGHAPQFTSQSDTVTVPDSEPARVQARAQSKEKRIPAEFPMLQFIGVSSTSSSSKGTIPVASGSRLPVVVCSKLLEESAGSSCDEYDSRMWNNKANTKDANKDIVHSSPSKRTVAQRKTSSHSDSDPSTHIKKSPRKNTSHTSPQINRRPSSPTPATRLPLKKIFGDVIELSDSDDSTLPSRALQTVHPLMVARARSKMTSQSTSATSTLVSAKPPPATKRRTTPSADVIDLT